MSVHTFRLGEIVILKLNALRTQDRAYEITRLLPMDGPEPLYRIKNAGEPYERVVQEHELRAFKATSQLDSDTLSKSIASKPN